MYEHYQTRVPEKVLKQSRKDIHNIYSLIPETTGCMEHHATCGAWCCQFQSPSVLYAEWMNTFWRISHEWSTERLSNLFLRAVETYLSDIPTKGCVFWDRDSKQCTQHYTRPFNCRTYGQVPEEEFKPRYEQLKILYEHKPNAVIRDQCNLVKSAGTTPTSKDMNEWFQQLKIIERDVLGVTYTQQNAPIHDREGGTYRAYHDHILLQMAPPEFLLQLTDLRLKGTDQEKDEFLKKLKMDLEEKLNAVDEDKSHTNALHPNERRSDLGS